MKIIFVMIIIMLNIDYMHLVILVEILKSLNTVGWSQKILNVMLPERKQKWQYNNY